MAYVTRSEESQYIIHLSNEEVIAVCDSSSPIADLTSLLITAADGGLSGGVLKAVTSIVIWRLKRKNIEFGSRGLRISFANPLLAVSLAPLLIAMVATSVRILPPE